MKHTLETERLELIPFEKDDLDLLYKTFIDPFVKEYLWDNNIITVEQTKVILSTNEFHFDKDNWGLWKIIVKSDGVYSGFVGLWRFFDEHQPQLIYGLLPDYTKKGYATEAASTIIDYAFTQLHFNYIIASCDSPHADSKKVAERLGMVLFAEKEINSKPTTFYKKSLN